MISKNLKIQKEKRLNLTFPALASLTLSACGGGGGGGGQLIAPNPNSAPTVVGTTTVTMDEDSSNIALSISTPTDSDGDSLTVTVTGLPTGGTLSTADGTEVTNDMTLTISQLTGLIFTPDLNLNDDNTSFGSFTYSVSDGTASSAGTVNISVTPVNDIPEFTSGPDLSIEENRSDINGLSADDVDNDTLTYSISGGNDQSFFTIDAATGALQFIDRQDYENPNDSDANNTYIVEITIDDGNGGTSTQVFNIIVSDVVTGITISNSSINENASGAVVGDLTAAIDDLNATHEYSYSLSGEGSENFEVVDGQLKLKDGVSLNFEEKSSYTLSIKATDTGGLTTTQEFTITINDVNDAPTDIDISRTGLMDNTDAAVVGTLTTVDEDADDNYTYTVSDDRFEIVDGVLRLKSGQSIDNLVESTVTLTIISTDKGGLSIEEEFVLTVGTVQITSTQFEENQAGAIIGTLSVIDDTSFSGTITYTVSGEGSENFEVVDGQLKLKDSFSANYEALNNFSITITATDSSGYTKSTTYPFDVIDVNEAPTAINLSNLTIDENSAGAEIGDLATTDEDTDDSHTYTLSGADAGNFEIVNGQLKLKDSVSANYEVKNTYAVTVTATDSGGLSISSDYTVTINDINDAPSAINLTGSLYLNEDDTGGVVGDITTVDEDAGDSHTYSITGDDAASFEVVNGQLKLKDTVSPVFATKSSYSITVTSTDSAGAIITKDYMVEVNARPTDISLSSDSVNESSYGLSVGTITATDPNTDDEFTYSITGGADQDYFEIDSSGVLKLKDNKFADFEVDDTLTVNITVTDQGGLSFEKTLNISVNDLAYATPYIADIRPVWNVPLSGDSDIDNQVWGFSYNLDRDSDEPITITYSIIGTDSVFASNYGDTYTSLLGDGFTDRIVNGSSEWETMVDQAFAYWGEVSGITFVKVEETATQVGDIRIGFQSSWATGVSAAGFSMTNKSSVYGSAAGDIWMTSNYDPINYDTNNSGSMSTLVHEIGHSLGLAHPHGSGGISTSDGSIWNAYSIMAYSGDLYLRYGWDIDGDGINEFNYGERIALTKPAINDIKAIQYIYGMTPDYNEGDTTYKFEGPIFESIYDTGGTDTIDLSYYNLDITLDLRGGTWSEIGHYGTKRSVFDSENWEWGNSVYSGFIISISENTVIEIAITGSGNDTITCNIAANSITCGLGNDKVTAISTGDSIFGGAGDDSFDISNSTDFTLIEGGAGNDRLSFQFIGSSLNLSDFTDAQITGIENIDIQWGSATILTLTKQDILNLNSDTPFDLDGDGDDDYVIWILCDSQDNILLSAENWSHDSNASSTYTFYGDSFVDYYTNDNGETYFATSRRAGVYEKTGDGDISITDQSVVENRADAAVGILSKGGLTQLSPYGSIFSVSGIDADKFEVDKDGTTLRLKTGTVFDYETQTTYNITITVLGVSTDYQITVIDGEENDIVGQHWSVAASETIIGTAADDFIDYDGGNDTIDGKSGNDILVIDHDKTSAFEILTAGGATKIKVSSSAGVDYAYDDVLLVNVESIKFNDQYVATNAESSSYDNIVRGSTSGESLNGTSGDDLIDSSGGNDKIFDTGGNDTLAIFSNSSNFEVMTVAGITKIHGNTYVSGYGSNYYNDIIKTFGIESIAFTDKTITLDTTYPSGIDVVNWSYSSLSETITGSDSDNLIDSSGGNDTIDGGAGNDTLALFGDRADFEVITLAGLTKIFGLSSDGLAFDYWTDTIRMYNVETIMFADQTITVETSSIGGNYNFWGSTSGTAITGTDGNDVIDSGGGNDTINGGAGDDTLLLFSDRADFEVITLAGLTKIFGLSSDGLAFDYWTDTIRMYNVETIMFADQTITVETSQLAGTDSNWFWGETYGQTYDTGDGNDVIDSGGGNDTINGGAGDDTLLLFSDRADFEVITLAGLTKIFGLSSDGLAFDYWTDTIRMYNVETIMFADQTITVETSQLAGTDSNWFWGETYGQTYDTGDGNDVIDSGGGNDTIDGGAGDDTLLLFADRSTFNITVNGNTITLTGNSSSGLAYVYWLDTITMTNVETIMFADQTVSVASLSSDYQYAMNSSDYNNDTEDEELDSNGNDVYPITEDSTEESITLPETTEFDTPIIVNLSKPELLDLLIDEEVYSEEEIIISAIENINDHGSDLAASSEIMPDSFDPVNKYDLFNFYDEGLYHEDLIYTSELG